MAYTTDQLNALEDALSQGVLMVQYADRRVTYQSVADMLRIRDIMRAELGMASPRSTCGRFIVLKVGKGL
jgi:hypothetical protein